MDRLWAPWRINYILSEKDQGCIFCDKPHQNADRKMLILFRGEQSFIMMNLYPYNNGHLLISPFEHVDNSNDLSKECRGEIMELADRSMNIIKQVMKADGFNMGANIGASGGAGIEEHIHFHLVPRWFGDTNFMPIVAHTKVQVDGLLETYDKLKTHFGQS